MEPPNLTLDEETLRHRLEELPDFIVPHVRMGFHLLTRVPPERRSPVVKWLVEQLAAGANVDSQSAAKDLGLNRNTVRMFWVH